MKVDANQRTRVHRRTIEFLVQQALGELFSGNNCDELLRIILLIYFIGV